MLSDEMSGLDALAADSTDVVVFCLVVRALTVHRISYRRWTSMILPIVIIIGSINRLYKLIMIIIYRSVCLFMRWV